MSASASALYYCHCCHRGFRVRVGICSGLVPGREVVYRKDLSGRMAYSGACMQVGLQGGRLGEGR